MTGQWMRTRFIAVLCALACMATLAGNVCGAAGAGDWKPAPSPLMTRWGKEVKPDKAWPEYPRPQMVRKEWRNLNGLWDFAMAPKADSQPQQFDKKILVPFPVESALSGIRGRVRPDDRLWYRRSFQVPDGWKGQRLLLHFGAVDWEAVVYVNGKEIGKHQGGYDPFTFDVTEAIQGGGPQELVVAAWDPTGPYARGKQVPKPGGIMYTSTSGIWQTVWLEPAPQNHIESFTVTPDVDAGMVRLVVRAKAGQVKAVALDNGKEIASADGKAGEELKLAIPKPNLWSPDSPYLYDLKIRLTDGAAMDEVGSYFAMRKISVGPDEKGVTRMLLNNKFVFQVGPLDQGFWPDGLYTPPSDEAVKFDVEMTRKYGFNMSRKHVKVEPDRWYYWCDKLGVMVWQDMPSGDESDDAQKKQFELELVRVIEAFRNHPCIIVWVPFNEGWGQYDTKRIAGKIKQQDPSRLVNNASGWSDEGAGDLLDIHSYPVPGAPRPEASRAAVIGEYGGLGFNLTGHMWKNEGWGYQSFQNFDDLNARYEELCRILRERMEDPGVSAGVYTQLTDIEVENNGLMTYDREVCKVDPKGSSLALQGYSAPVKVVEADLFIGEGSAEIKCGREDAQIRYTQDGSDPSKSSTLYQGPIKVKEATTVRARAFWANGFESRVLEFRLTPTTAAPAVKLPEKAEAGLQVSYFEDSGLSREKLPDFSTLKPARVAVAKEISIKPAEPRKENYALRFEGYLTVPATGVYVFYLSADDRAKLTIDGKDVIAVDYTQGTPRAAVGLEAGAHALRLDHCQSIGGESLDLKYAGPDIPRRDIPLEALSHAPAAAQ